MEGRCSFDGDEWSDVSDEAIDFIGTLLTYDEKRRPSAAEALNHQWLNIAKMEMNETFKKKDAVSSLVSLFRPFTLLSSFGLTLTYLTSLYRSPI